MKTLQSILTKSQTKKFTFKRVETEEYGLVDFYIDVRYDDQCNNGHNSFAITGSIVEAGMTVCDRFTIVCGAIGDRVEKYIPELAHLNKWHLCSSDEPMHYIANTLYHVSDTDHNGLKKGEYSRYTKKVMMQIHHDNTETCVYKTNTLYTNKQQNPNLEKSNNKELSLMNEFINNLNLDYSIVIENDERSISEGKTVDIEAARRCAVWPEATLEQLRDSKLLADRLPALMENFKNDIEALGFIF